jgi:hypothetical protein
MDRNAMLSSSGIADRTAGCVDGQRDIERATNLEATKPVEEPDDWSPEHDRA